MGSLAFAFVVLLRNTYENVRGRQHIVGGVGDDAPHPVTAVQNGSHPEWARP